jgi:hypothetical protein
VPVLLMTSKAEVGQRQVFKCYLIEVGSLSDSGGQARGGNEVQAVGSGDLTPVQIGGDLVSCSR